MQKKALQKEFSERPCSVGRDALGDAVTVAGRRILERLLAGYDGPVAVRLWNGERVHGKADAPCTLVFNQPSVLRHLVLHRDLAHLAESFLAGALDVEGDMESLFDLADHACGLHFSWPDKWRLLRQALRLPASGAEMDSFTERHGGSRVNNTRQSIAHHYDVSNDFYRLWLDPEMVYSCAYFRNTKQSLASAQRDKLDYIVQVYGITLSEQQYRNAAKRVRSEGLQGHVTIELRDYRELSEEVHYDRVVSVGMFEHIGVANFPRYFGTVKRVLKPGGLFLNHGITNDSGWRDTPITRFMNRYVFPDGELARISDVSSAMEQAGFEIIDLEGLRRHYALTLRHWVQALEAHSEQAVAMVGEATYRIWRLYMAGCAYYFDEGSTNVYQVLAGSAHQPLATPLRRDDLYKESVKEKHASAVA